MDRPLEDPPSQRVRKFKTPGDGRVTWTWDPDYIKHGHLRHWGRTVCTGCRLDVTGIEWYRANEHARQCHQIP